MSWIDSARRLHLNRCVEQQERQPQYISFDQAATMLLLYQSDDFEQNEFIRNLTRRLSDQGKRVYSVGYVDKKRAMTASLETTLMLDRSHLNLWGQPERSFVDHMLEQDFDIVLDLTLHPIMPLQYVLLWANGSVKAGAKIDAGKLLDIMIELPQVQKQPTDEEPAPLVVDESYLFQQLEFYLRAIAPMPSAMKK